MDKLVGEEVVDNLDKEGHAHEAIDNIITFDNSKCAHLYTPSGVSSVKTSSRCLGQLSACLQDMWVSYL